MRYYFTMLDFNTLATVTHTHTHRHYTTPLLHEAGNLGSDGVNDSEFAGMGVISPAIGPSNGSKYLQLARL